MDEQKQKIINAYRDLKYSDIVQENVTSSAPVALAENKFNRYTFSGNYNGAVVTSANTLRNGFNDTLIFSDASFDDGTLKLDLVDGTGDQKDLQITSNGKTVLYKDYLNGNNSDLIIIDSNNRKMSVAQYVPDDNNAHTGLLTTYTFANSGSIGTYNAVYVKDEGSHGYNEDVSFNMSGKSHNYVYTEGGIKVNINQSGDDCHSTVVTKSATNDRYYAGTTGHLLVEENGGNDRIQFASDYNTEFNYDGLGII